LHLGSDCLLVDFLQAAYSFSVKVVDQCVENTSHCLSFFEAFGCPKTTSDQISFEHCFADQLFLQLKQSAVFLVFVVEIKWSFTFNTPTLIVDANQTLVVCLKIPALFKLSKTTFLQVNMPTVLHLFHGLT